jgi:hypothetical protein
MKLAVAATSLVVALLMSVGLGEAAPPSPSALVAHAAELPGFGAAKAKIRSASTAYRYLHVVLEEPSVQARRKASKLERRGFREGVRELLSASQGEALSIAIVFDRRRGAREEFNKSVAESRKAQGGATITPLATPAIPGASAFTAAEPGHPGGAANVLFTSGRCFFLVGDFLRTAPPDQLGAAPLAGATALYERTRALCS